MAKDAHGHGSDGRGSTADRIDAQRKAQGYAPLSRIGRGFNDFMDDPSGHLAAAQGAMGIAAQHGIDVSHLSGRLSDMTPEQRQALRERDAAQSRDEANRDYALRIRNGQIGSGMKFRG